jgi:pantetheine-phosphate adenylyltransferase
MTAIRDMDDELFLFQNTTAPAGVLLHFCAIGVTPYREAMSTTAMYPGSFDPITNGHIDVIERASTMFDHVIVVIGINAKKTPLFTDAERVELARAALEHIPNVSVRNNDRLTIDFARDHDCRAIIRGVRAISDFEAEFQIALMNRKLEPSVNTVFLMPHEKYTFLNSSIIRELARYGQDVSEFVPPAVNTALRLMFSDAYSRRT